MRFDARLGYSRRLNFPAPPAVSRILSTIADISQPHPHRLTPRDLSLVLLINVIWGINLVTSKYGVRELQPMWFTTVRMALMLTCCLPWLRWFPGQMRDLCMIGLVSGAGAFGFLAYGLNLSKDVSTVAIFTQLMVPFSTLLSVLILGEVIHWRRKVGITMAFVGVLIIGFDPRALSYLPGLLFVVLQALCAAFGMIFIKRLHGVGLLQLQAWTAAFALPVMLVMSLWLEHGQLHALQHASVVAWLALAIAVLGSNLFAQTVFLGMLRKYPISRVAPMTLLQVVFGMIAGVAINHDVLTLRMLFGAAVTLCGVLVIEIRTTKPLAPPTP